MPERPLVRRRTAVLGAAATILLAGCDHGDDIGEPTPIGSTSPSPTSSATPALTPDEALVAAVNEQLAQALTVLAHSRKARHLGPVVAPFIRAHQRHLEVLQGESPSMVLPGPPPSSKMAIRALRASETQLRAALVDAATRAESGSLAKLLASMAASVTQHLDALPGRA